MEENTSGPVDNSKSKMAWVAVFAIIILLGIGGFVFLNKQKSSDTSESSIVAVTETSKDISLEEVEEHSTKEDCWIAIEGGVYDVSSFVPKHPGEDAILLGCGKDATSMFNSRPNDGTSHSVKARQTLKTFQIGVLSGS